MTGRELKQLRDDLAEAIGPDAVPQILELRRAIEAESRSGRRDRL